MGYETRLYVVDRHSYPNSPRVMGFEIARFNLGKINCNGLFELFQTPIDFHLYEEDGNTYITEDRYEDPICYAPIDAVIDCLEKNIELSERYMHVPNGAEIACCDYLKSLRKQGQYRELVVAHYGY